MNNWRYNQLCCQAFTEAFTVNDPCVNVVGIYPALSVNRTPSEA
jgi:hypothetical protein